MLILCQVSYPIELDINGRHLLPWAYQHLAALQKVLAGNPNSYGCMLCICGLAVFLADMPKISSEHWWRRISIRDSLDH